MMAKGDKKRPTPIMRAPKACVCRENSLSFAAAENTGSGATPLDWPRVEITGWIPGPVDVS
jgi:hypothetical protein